MANHSNQTRRAGSLKNRSKHSFHNTVNGDLISFAGENSILHYRAWDHSEDELSSSTA